jgi:hypothetical protein
MTLSVLSLLARQDVDPWQEASRLTQLSGAEAINSLAARIWKSDSEQWSPSEASMLAARLIKLLPSHNLRSTPPWTEVELLDGHLDCIHVDRHIRQQHAER